MSFLIEVLGQNAMAWTSNHYVRAYLYVDHDWLDAYFFPIFLHYESKLFLDQGYGANTIS